MMTRHCAIPLQRQSRYSHVRGAATLLLSVVLLLVLSIVAAYTSRSSLNDLNVIGTQARLKEAQSHAEAALDCMLAQYQANGLLETGAGARTPQQILAQECLQRDLSGLSVEQLRFLRPAELDATNGLSQATLFAQCPAALETRHDQTEGGVGGHLYAVGRSNDGSAVYCVGVMVSSQKAIGRGTASLGTITAAVALPAKLTGNLTVTNNNPGGVTIWTGTDIGAMNGSFETKIAVEGRTDQTSSGKDGNRFFVGPDVVYNDPQIRSQAQDPVTGVMRPFADFYSNMLGVDLSTVVAGADLRLGAGQALPSATDGHAGKIIYVNPGTNSFDPNMDLGTAAQPVLLIVEGDLTLNGNNTIYGTVVARNLKGLNGTVKIVGNLLAQSMEDLNGNLRVTAPAAVPPDDKTDPRNFWMYMPVAGTWRDWPGQP